MHFYFGTDQCNIALRRQVGRYGMGKACETDSGLKKGLNIVNGKVVFPAVAEAFGWKI